MSKSILTVRVDHQTKTEARRLAQEAGLSLSHLIDLQLQQLVAKGRVDMGSAIEPSPSLEKNLKKIKTDVKAGRNIEGPFKTTSELFKALKLPPRKDT